MSRRPADPVAQEPGELEELLQFLYVCPFGVVEFDRDGVVGRITPHAVNVCVAASGYIGLTNFLPVLERYAPETVPLVRDGGPPGPLLSGRQLTVRSPNRAPAMVSLSLVRVDAERCMAVLVDESPAATFASLAAELAPLVAQDDVARVAARAAADLFGAARTVISWRGVRRDDDEALPVWQEARTGPDGSVVVGEAAAPSSGPAAQALRSGETVSVMSRADLEALHPGWDELEPALDGRGTAASAVLAMPLSGEDGVSAVLRLDFRVDPGADADYVQRLRLLGGLLVTALERARLYTAEAVMRRRSESLATRLAAANDELAVALARIEADEARFRALVEHSADAVVVQSRLGGVRYASPAFYRITDDPPGSGVGAPLSEWVHPDDRWRLPAAGVLQHRSGEVVSYECRVRSASGWRHLEVTASDRLDDPAVGGIVHNLRDVTDRVEATARLAHQAMHDALTDLPNRALLRDRLDQALARAERSGVPCALVFLDLDRFKQVNDTLGHRAGDQVLTTVASRLTEVVRGVDSLARLGGDEFVVLVEGVDTPEVVLDIARRITASIDEPMLVADRSLTLGCSMGIAISSSHGPEALLQEADMALHRAKESGRNRWEIYDAAMRLQARQRLDVEELLRHAITADRVVLHYQPVVDLASGATVGHEALARIVRPDGGPALPGEFVAVAEDSGLVVQLGARVLDLACAAVAAGLGGRDAAGSPLRMAVNVSARQLVDESFVDLVAATLARHRVDPATLCVEITESTLIEIGSSVQSRVRELKDLGVRLALDDFGTGWSSLSYLRRFPLDVVKIDRSFVAGLGVDAGDTVLVRAVVDMARALGLSTVAEGVETREQSEQLRALGCEQAQGFLFGRPRPL